MERKKCSKCKEEKPLTSEFFYRSRKSKNGFKSRCKDCQRVDNRKWRESKGPEYATWENMKRRCVDENNWAYQYYGERGIKVCDDWVNSFDNFIRDMGRRPGENYTLDRLDNDGDYTKENCKWVTWQDQSINKRAGKRKVSPETGVAGVWWREDRNKWTAYISANNKRYYLGYFDNLDDAIEAREQAELKYWN